MPEASVVNDGSTVNVTATADWPAGTVVQVPDLRAGVIQVGVPSGERGAALVRGRVEATKATATVFAAGAAVYWNGATKLAVTAAGGGIYRLGLAVYAAGSGPTVVTVDLNEIALIQT
jgi:predicted RecA/RadA family phage recombinase